MLGDKEDRQHGWPRSSLAKATAWGCRGAHSQGVQTHGGVVGHTHEVCRRGRIISPGNTQAI